MSEVRSDGTGAAKPVESELDEDSSAGGAPVALEPLASRSQKSRLWRTGLSFEVVSPVRRGGEPRVWGDVYRSVESGPREGGRRYLGRLRVRHDYHVYAEGGDYVVGHFWVDGNYVETRIPCGEYERREGALPERVRLADAKRGSWVETVDLAAVLRIAAVLGDRRVENQGGSVWYVRTASPRRGA